jgi:predicted nucleic acid-binding protein
VFVDANVLASRTLRDWLFMLRNESRMYQLHTTPDVVAETVRAVRRRYKTAPGRMIIDLQHLLETNLDELLADFRSDVPFKGADPDDYHVHAAAMACRADILLTDDADGFGDPELLDYDICASDDFLCLADASSPQAVREVTRQQNAYWRKRSATGTVTKPLAQALSDAGCPEFAVRVDRHLRVLAGLPAETTVPG